MDSLINKAGCRKLALHYSKELRGDKFTQVSSQYLNELEAAVKSLIEQTVKKHRTFGKTIKEFNSLIIKKESR